MAAMSVPSSSNELVPRRSGALAPAYLAEIKKDKMRKRKERAARVPKPPGCDCPKNGKNASRHTIEIESLTRPFNRPGPGG